MKKAVKKTKQRTKKVRKSTFLLINKKQSTITVIRVIKNTNIVTIFDGLSFWL